MTGPAGADDPDDSDDTNDDTEEGEVAGTSSKPRHEAAEAYVWALRRGEATAAERASNYLAEDVVLERAAGNLEGRQAVLEHITGVWPTTPVLQFGGWSDPIERDGSLVVEAEFPAMGAAPLGATVTFSFNDKDQIQTVNEKLATAARPEPQKEIPLAVRGLIDGALANGTPLVVAYVNDAGEPSLSLRGSTQVFSPTQISIWLRNAESGLSSAIQKNPNMSLLYRDSKLRTTLIIKGKGHIENDEETRRRAFELAPEVEQLHSPRRTGAALIIDVTEIRGGGAKGNFLIQP
ncbi:MAG: hypothetical protein J2P59_11645 [Acidimicrobiales bacterium]|nr:hypothetical protein [Acidimicrobiales bacterium]